MGPLTSLSLLYTMAVGFNPLPNNSILATTVGLQSIYTILLVQRIYGFIILELQPLQAQKTCNTTFSEHYMYIFHTSVHCTICRSEHVIKKKKKLRALGFQNSTTHMHSRSERLVLYKKKPQAQSSQFQKNSTCTCSKRAVRPLSAQSTFTAMLNTTIYFRLDNLKTLGSKISAFKS